MEGRANYTKDGTWRRSYKTNKVHAKGKRYTGWNMEKKLHNGWNMEEKLHTGWNIEENITQQMEHIYIWRGSYTKRMEYGGRKLQRKKYDMEALP